MNNYCIYKHTNKQNKKVYIGQTCQKPEYRWNNGEGYKECPRFYHAIKKYGWESFEHEILETNLTLEQANIREEYWIMYYKSTDINYGYNLSSGGLNKTPSEETKEKLKNHSKALWQKEAHRQYMSDVMKQKWTEKEYREKQREARKNSSHIISEQGKENIRQARKEYIAQHGTPTQGIGHSQETIEKIRLSKIGEKNPMYGKTTSDKQKQVAREVNSKKVLCVETGQIFNSRQEAASWCGLKSASSISGCISGAKKSAGKHPETKQPLHWKTID